VLFAAAWFFGFAGLGDLTNPLAPDSLQGTWEILSVYRDGSPDPAQVGARLVFAGDKVTLLPRVAQVTDGIS
jgi:hypothetical protein